ncbi:rod-binding protein [Sinisalibacter aestuarii]|uniref:Peptidoglycan hydrolase n=1 Tax=Sinisalibacter aestuarii TaxID=2949426 RepID=A0ABQ5LP15_9RHOB|nr:rod-binding protein [Sinisalibacter aestuarii]GKY86701.1 peptidoglycan hydrolase [Sinisalibacter aestuarii]
MTPLDAFATPAPRPDTARRDAALHTAARELEASFLAEMLKSAGLGDMPDAFGGGAGEEQFASFLRLEQARAMVGAGGIGLARSLFDALKERADNAV